MNSILRSALAASTVAIATQAAAQVTLYEHPNFQGQSFTTQQQLGNLERNGFNNRASSAVVRGETWQVCDGPGYSGQCAILRPGDYPSLGAMGLNDSVSSVRVANTDVRSQENRYAPAVAGQVTFYENERFAGRSFTTEQSIGNLERYGFNNRASSAVIRGETWQVCDAPGYGGRCVVLRPGDYASLSAMGLNDSISSVRAVNRDARTDDNRGYAQDNRGYSPAPVARDYRRRSGERLYEANVTSVRAVVGTPEQRCWVEREQISQDRRNVNVPGAIAGAVIGGIIGHQVGSGRHQDLATAGGAVAGGAIGANVGRSGDGQYAQDVQRCETVNSQARPDHWDVTYSFRGQEHRMQMTSPPGSTVTVNEQGEPRA
jgi:uncharacterized protein YcfJ